METREGESVELALRSDLSVKYHDCASVRTSYRVSVGRTIANHSSGIMAPRTLPKNRCSRFLGRERLSRRALYLQPYRRPSSNPEHIDPGPMSIQGMNPWPVQKLG